MLAETPSRQWIGFFLLQMHLVIRVCNMCTLPDMAMLAAQELVDAIMGLLLRQ